MRKPMSNNPVVPPSLPQGVEELIAGVILEIAELPDRTSPDDWPEAMLVTGEELEAILAAFARALEQGRAQASRSTLRPHLHTEACYAGEGESDVIRCAEAHKDVPDGRAQAPAPERRHYRQAFAPVTACGLRQRGFCVTEWSSVDCQDCLAAAPSSPGDPQQ